MIFLQPNWILAFVCAFTYFAMGEFESRHAGRANHGMVWAGLSIALSALVIHVFQGGWGFVLLTQIGLYVGITLYRVLREP